MSDQESQGVSAEMPPAVGTPPGIGTEAPKKKRNRTPGKILGGNKIAKKPLGESQEIKNERDKKKEKRGHMALRNNVHNLKLDLWLYLKPIEYFLLDVIIDKTIKWRAKEARIDIAEFVARTQKHEKYIYGALRNLIKKKIITKRRDKHFSYYGLNEDYFGGVLITRHEKAWNERPKLRLAVNNSKPNVDTNQASSG
jgi:hypothetical protein